MLAVKVALATGTRINDLDVDIHQVWTNVVHSDTCELPGLPSLRVKLRISRVLKTLTRESFRKVFKACSAAGPKIVKE